MKTCLPSQLRRRAVLLGLAALGTSSALPARAADDYPARTIKIVVPYAPGGSTDVVARLLADKLALSLKQAVVVENKPGANGMIGAEMVARAAPDGYTLFFPAGSVLGLTPLLYKANYDPVKSFAPIGMVASWSLLLVANASLPTPTLKDFVELVHSGKRPVNFAAGTSGYSLMCEQLKLHINAPQLLNVPYNGSGPQLQSVVSGQTDVMIDTFNSVQMIRNGKLRALGIFSEKRSPTLPDVPTMKEQGIDMVTKGYAALLAPANTPPAIVQRLQTEMAKVVALPEVRDQFARVDYEPVGSTSKELAAAIQDDIARYRKMVKDTGFKINP
ncbi:tripartite tricarboxylate transporter substrate binding protein [Piscinibacter sp. HJYY11]|uniref:Bug family tripartite tricarboxylate transporter substrate binding protein n=1 Tax=Piscinibacter sp. HJYY11 TaxID=2801333 RepID=UPI001F3C2C65|nr:tripartite tricarboxylate transporter substrate binding protein [Piscinibacter sp. HJYY11]